MTDNVAVMRGYTRHVEIDIGGSSFAALIKPEADLDGTFRAFDTDNQEWIAVNGWLAESIEDIPDNAAADLRIEQEA